MRNAANAAARATASALRRRTLRASAPSRRTSTRPQKRFSASKPVQVNDCGRRSIPKADVPSLQAPLLAEVRLDRIDLGARHRALAHGFREDEPTVLLALSSSYELGGL